MAGAVDKYAGAVVGMHHGFSGGSAPQRSALEVASTASCEERLVVGDKLLIASLDTRGSIVWSESKDTDEAKRCIVQQSQMASMLRDTYRNSVYAAALERHVEQLTVKLGRAPRVLDVGAGTGLLSLLAARAGAATVHGIEQWDVMASIAQQVTALSAPSTTTSSATSASTAIAQPKGMCSINIHNAHSTSLNVSPHFEGQRFVLVVSEILDSALLGEGMIPAMKDVFARLLTTDAQAVPLRATVYAQLVHSSAASLWQDSSSCVLRPPEARMASLNGSSSSDNDGPGLPPLTMAARSGCQALHPTIPVHASQLLESGDMRLVSEPIASLIIDFGSGNPMIRSGTSESTAQGQSIEEKVYPALPALERAEVAPANAVLWWWEVVLHDGDESKGQAPITYSTHWTAVRTGAQGWQDHWTQCLQPLPSPTSPSSGTFTLAACHNNSKVWFYAGPGGCKVWSSKRTHKVTEKKLKADTSKEAQTELESMLSAPGHLYMEPQPCICGVHSCTSVDRRWALASRPGESTHGTGRVDALRISIDASLQHILSLKREEASELAAALGAVDDDDVEGGTDGAQGVGLEAQHRIRMMDLSEGGVSSLLALTCETNGMPITAFIPRYTPVIGKPTAGAAGTCTGIGIGTEPSDGGGPEAEVEEEQEQAPDPLLLHVQNLVSSWQSEGRVSSHSALIPIPLPAYACSPQYLSLEEETHCKGEEEEEEEEAEDSNDEEQHVDEDTGVTGAVQLDMLCGEPFFQNMSSSQLWTASAWWARVQGAKIACASPCFVAPSSFTIYAQPVTFTHLHTSFAPPVGPVSGFDHTPFTVIQEGYYQHTFNLPLWQYQYSPAQEPVALLTVDVRCSLPVSGQAWPVWDEQLRIGAAGSGSGSCTGTARAQGLLASAANAVIYWVEYNLQPADIHGQAKPVPLPTGLQRWPSHSGAALPLGHPNPYRQAVRFIPLQQVGKFSTLDMAVAFNTETGLFEPSATAR